MNLPSAGSVNAFGRHLDIFGRFGRGWLRREDACLALALRMDKPKFVSTINGK